MNDFWNKVKNFFKLITPWIKWGIKEFKEERNSINELIDASKTEKALQKKK